MMMNNKTLTALLVATATSVNGFTIVNTNNRFSTKVFLKDSVADMIDHELLRLQHKKEAQEQFKTKNAKVIDEVLPTAFDFNENFYEQQKEAISKLNDNNYNPILKRDTKLAMQDPQQYCADRCVATGNCEVFEDMYHLTPVQVMEFCTDCVLSVEEEPCDVPDAMFSP